MIFAGVHSVECCYWCTGALLLLRVDPAPPPLFGARVGGLITSMVIVVSTDNPALEMIGAINYLTWNECAQLVISHQRCRCCPSPIVSYLISFPVNAIMVPLILVAHYEAFLLLCACEMRTVRLTLSEGS